MIKAVVVSKAVWPRILYSRGNRTLQNLGLPESSKPGKGDGADKSSQFESMIRFVLNIRVQASGCTWNGIPCDQSKPIRLTEVGHHSLRSEEVILPDQSGSLPTGHRKNTIAGSSR